MVIYEATSSNFKKYGRIVKNIDFAPVIEALYYIFHESILIHNFCSANTDKLC